MSPLGSSQWVGAGFTQWFNQDTLKLDLLITKSDNDSPVTDTIDTDVVRVVTPKDVSTDSFSATLTHFTTPTTIIIGSISQGKRSDRPDAQSASLELREFFKSLAGAFHGGIAHYENLGEIKPITLYGTVVANSFFGEWQQRFMDKFIGRFGYRQYLETEDPRATESPVKQLGSDYIYGSLRYRNYDKSWLDQADEYFAFAGYYKSNAPSTSTVVGVGIKTKI
jgi:hypothetical protein